MGLVHQIWHTILLTTFTNFTVTSSHFVTEFSKCHKMSQNFRQASFVTERHHVTGNPFSVNGDQAPFCLLQRNIDRNSGQNESLGSV